ncbi:MAG: TolC family protein [Bacteroidaceae bacterium]|nr:TolC family protein [Bacteroidaceae bacterium]
MKNYILSIVFFLSATVLYATEKPDTTLSLQECLDMAIEKSSQTNVASLKVKQMEYTKRSVMSNFFPKIAAAAGYLYSNASLQYSMIPGVFDLNLEFGSIYGAGATVTQPIFVGGKIVSGYKMAKTGAGLASLNNKMQQEDIVCQVEEAYWNCLKAQKMTDVLNEYVQTLSSFKQDVVNAVDLGALTSTDLLEVESKCGQANLDLRKAQNMNRLAAMNLCRLTGLPLVTKIGLEEPVTPQENLVAIIQDEFDATRRTEYQMLQAQIEMQRQQINITRADFLPQIAAVGSYSYLNGMTLNDTKLVDDNQFGVMVTGAIPLFQWGEGHNKIRSEKAKLSIMEMERDEAVSKMQLQAMQAENILDEAIMAYSNSETLLSYAQENMKVVNDRYELGAATVSEKLKAQTELQKAQVDRITAMCDLNLAVTSYKKAMSLE